MSKRKTTEEFIISAIKVHKNKYKYDKVEYINSNTKVIILCPEHGEFEQKAANHLQGKGCRACANATLAAERSDSIDHILQKFRNIHGDRYDYTKVQYVNARTKVTIVCPIHGDFEQTPEAHLRGQLCPLCANESRGRSLTQKEFIERALKIHGIAYSYENTSYIGWSSKVTITCAIHGEFKQSPREHLQGCGCPKCAKHGFNPNKPAYLYYLKITTDDNEILYKIGITNRTVEERFNLTDLSKIEIVKQKLYKNGQDAWDWEQLFKKKYKSYQYKGPSVLSSGNSELFTENIYSKFIEEFQ